MFSFLLRLNSPNFPFFPLFIQIFLFLFSCSTVRKFNIIHSWSIHKMQATERGRGNEKGKGVQKGIEGVIEIGRGWSQQSKVKQKALSNQVLKESKTQKFFFYISTLSLKEYISVVHLYYYNFLAQLHNDKDFYKISPK